MSDTTATQVLIRYSDEAEGRALSFTHAATHPNEATGHFSASGGTVLSTDFPQWADILVRRYVESVLAREVVTQQDDEDGRWFAEVPALDGPWASGETEAEAIRLLEPVISDWLWLKIEDRDGDIPVMHGIDLNVL